jgi:hypothetical protein
MNLLLLLVHHGMYAVRQTDDLWGQDSLSALCGKLRGEFLGAGQVGRGDRMIELQLGLPHCQRRNEAIFEFLAVV